MDIMQRAGFASKDTGPFVTELREAMERKQANGLIYASPGTWATGGFWTVEAEVRAKAMLALDWSIERGHTYRVECLDPLIYWQYNVRNRKRKLVVKWHSLPAWLGDRKREFGMHYRIWRDRNLVNPYR